MQCGITKNNRFCCDRQARRNAKNAAGSVGLLLLLDLFVTSVVLHHYPCLFNRTKSCVWQLPVYLSASVSAEGVVKLSASVSVSAKSQFMTFGRVSVSAETRNSVSVGLYLCPVPSQLVSDLRVSDVIKTVAEEDDITKDRCLFQDDYQRLCLHEINQSRIFHDDMIFAQECNYLVNGLSALMTWLCLMCRYVSWFSCLCFIWMAWTIALNAVDGSCRVGVMNIAFACQDVSTMPLSGCECVSSHEWQWWKQKSCLHSDVEIVLLCCPNVVICSCSSQIVVCHHVESMQCWHISYGGVGVSTCRKLIFDALTERHSVHPRSKRRTFECSGEWLSFQRLCRKVVVSWQPWLCSYAVTLDQVRVTCWSWRLPRIFGCGVVSMYLDLETGVFGTLSVGVLWTFLVTTKCQCLFGRCSRPCYFLSVMG